MEFLLSRFRNLTVLVVVILAQLVLLAYQVKSNQDVRLIRVWAVTAVTPLARVLEFVRRNTIGVVEDYIVLINVREQNQNLQDELGKLKLENQFLKTELETADRAQALQAFQSRTPSRTIPARIIGNGTGANAKVVFLDQGSSSGVMRGMAVVTPAGIVGKVLAAYPYASQVLLVTDPTFAAGVISEKNRVHGTLKGLGQSKCLVDYVQNEEKVDVGEVFFTSGDDRVFPKGFPVGTATVVREGKTFKEIFVVPSGLESGLEEVLIVLEGVHQQIPQRMESPSQETYILPAPPADPVSNLVSRDSALGTDADRLRKRYKQIGEEQRHVFGEGAPGSKPPNFNVDPSQVKKNTAPAPSPGSSSPARSKPAVPRPVPPPAESAQEPAGQPAPGATQESSPAPAQPTESSEGSEPAANAPAP